MTQPIDRETAIALAKEAGFKASIGQTVDDKYHPDRNAIGKSVPVEWVQRFYDLAVAHSRNESVKKHAAFLRSVYGDSQPETRSTEELNCPHCGGSGHIDDAAHSRKDAEAVAYQYRMKPEWHDAWVKWQPCEKTNFDDYVKAPVVNGWQFDARALFTNPPEADKLLQQALEALEYRLQQTRPIHQADVVMESIRTYLENKA